jgi:uncharacterized protein
MMRDSSARVSLAGLLLVLGACASPREHFYLLAQSGPEGSDASAKIATVLVGPVVIPAEVDRPQIVVRKDPHEVAFNEQERWAVPLKEALPRLLAAELSRKAKNTRFVPMVSGVSSAPKARLSIDVTRFDVSHEAGATVALHWVYRSDATNIPPLEGDALARSPVESPGVGGLLDALQRAVAEVAEVVGRHLPDDS